jgi:hypothetical protein
MVAMWRPGPVLALITVLFFPAVHAQVDHYLGEAIEQGSIESTSGRSLPYRFRLLPPASFPQLPAAVRRTLDERQCMIPQTFQAHTPENVVRGEFQRAGSSDWALLCSQNGSTTLLVFFAGAAQPIEFVTHKDTDLSEVYDLTGVRGFAWSIDTAHPLEIKAEPRNRQSGPFDHDGIADAYLGHSAAIHYFRDGKWLSLEGGD